MPMDIVEVTYCSSCGEIVIPEDCMEGIEIILKSNQPPRLQMMYECKKCGYKEIITGRILD